MTLAQRAILFLEILDAGQEFVDPFFEAHELEIELRFLEFSTGRISVLTAFQASANQGLTASADGATILYSGRPSELGSDLIVVQNFR